MKVFLVLFALFAFAILPSSASAATANQLIAALQSAVVANGNTDVNIMLKVSGAHSAGDQISSVSSITFVGATETVYPGSPTVDTAAVVNVLLP